MASTLYIEKLKTACLVTLTVIAITGALYILKPVLVPFMFSIFIYFLIAPSIDFQVNKLRFPKLLALTISILLVALVITLFVFIMTISIQSVLQSRELFQGKLLVLLDHFSILAQTFGYNLDVVHLKGAISNLPIFGWVKSFSGGIMNLIGNTTLIIIFVFFFMIEKTQMKEGKATALIDPHVQYQVSRYLTIKIIISTITGIIFWSILKAFDVQLALVFATVTFMLNFIPNVGPLIATLIPLPILLIQFGLSQMVILIFLVLMIVQFFIGNILETKMMGKTLGLHPVVVLLTLLFWGFIWGTSGMFLAIPITAVIKLALEREPLTKRFSKILEGDISFINHFLFEDKTQK